MDAATAASVRHSGHSPHVVEPVWVTESPFGPVVVPVCVQVPPAQLVEPVWE
jgi:hypothetical protein